MYKEKKQRDTMVDARGLSDTNRVAALDIAAINAAVEACNNINAIDIMSIIQTNEAKVPRKRKIDNLEENEEKKKEKKIEKKIKKKEKIIEKKKEKNGK